MKTPDITPAQIVALVKSVLILLAAFGLALTDKQLDAILALVALVVPVALVIADAVIRKGRAEMHGKVEMAKVILPEND